MKSNKKSSDELNYKQAYFYLFHQITDIIKRLKMIQRKAEDICVDETTSENPEINTEEILQGMINSIRENQE